MNRATDLLNERINWLEDEISDLEESARNAISTQEKTGFSIASGLLLMRERKLTALHELKAVLSETLRS